MILFSEFSVDILCISETWLIPAIGDSFVDISGYKIVRTDTTGSTMKHGVCIYVKNCISFYSVVSSVANLHCIKLSAYDIYVILVYRPPSNTLQQNSDLNDFLNNFCIDKEVLIVGDFNLPNILWTEGRPSNISLDPTSLMFSDTFTSNSLLQLVTEPTFVTSGNILDLVLVNSADRVGGLGVYPPLPRCGHCPVLFDYNFQFIDNCDVASNKRSWWKGDYQKISLGIDDVDWVHEFLCLSPSEMFARFIQIVRPLIEKHVPLRTPGRNLGSFVPPTSLRRQKTRLWNRYKYVRSSHGRRSSGALEAYMDFNEINETIRNYHINAQVNHEKGLIDLFKENSKFFHSYIRRKKVGTPSVGPLRLNGGSLTDKPSIMADLLADTFSSFYNCELTNSLTEYNQIFNGNLDTVPISEAVVSEKIGALDASSSMGPDGVHPMLLKSCPGISFPLYLIFKASLAVGSLPSQWKYSDVVPIFKKGSRYEAINYRPISLTSICSKTLERIIADHIIDFLSINSLISKEQYGFRAGHMVEDQLILAYDDVSKWYDMGYTVDVILFDFSKAFDKVSHVILIRKLYLIGVRGRLLSWLSSFLQGRQMSVCVSGVRSSCRDVVSGVPQGSVLGPLLFILYINHLPDLLKCKCKIFADDLKIYLKIRHQSQVDTHMDVRLVQDDIDKIFEVSMSWGLTLNADKCTMMRFGRHRNLATTLSYMIGGFNIPRVESARDLGIIVDEELKFHTHARSVSCKASGLSMNILKTTLCRSEEFMKTILITYLRPLIEFSSCVWSSGYICYLMLEKVQRRWKKRIIGMGDLGYRYRLRRLNLYSVKGRLLRYDLIKYWKIFHGRCSISPSDIFSTNFHPSTRGHTYKVSVPISYTECRKRCFSVRQVNLWNSMPDYMVETESLEEFKRKLHDFLGEKLFEYHE